MKKQSIFILLVFLSVLYGCKKEVNRIVSPTYELDSIVYSSIDTMGNETHNATLILNPNYLRNRINNFPSGVLSYYENNDTILLKEYSLYCSNLLQEYNTIINGKFSTSYYFAYANYICDDHNGHKEAWRFINYDSTERLNSILMSYTNFIANSSKNNTEFVFHYNGNNIENIDMVSTHFNDVLSHPYDSTISSLNITGNTDYFPHHYPNQRNLIGIDINDFLIYPLLLNYNQYGLSSLTIINPFDALIFNKQATFNTHCDYLIENFYTYDSYNLYPIHISYEFETKFNNRLKSIITDNGIANTTKYKSTFYYRY